MSAPIAPRAGRPDLGRVTVILAAHLVTDFFSTVIVPLLSVLEGRLDLSPAQGALLVAAGMVCSGVIQPVVALASDRFRSRLFAPAGLLLAVLSISFVSHAETFGQLMLIQALGTAGIGAFHPPAAAMCGQLSGERRTQGITWFFLSGMVGTVMGIALVPRWVKSAGLESVQWLVVPGMLSVVALYAFTRRAPFDRHTATRLHAAMPGHERRARWGHIGVLYVGAALRHTVNMAFLHLVIRWSEAETLARTGAAALTRELRLEAATTGGDALAAMQVGMAVLGLMLGARVRPGNERAAMVFVPMIGAGIIALFPVLAGAPDLPARLGRVLPLVLAFGAGAGFAGVLPVSIALAQRLLPHRTGLASSLMMGGSWALAAAGPPAAQVMLERWGLDAAFLVTGLALALSGCIGLALRERTLAHAAGVAP